MALNKTKLKQDIARELEKIRTKDGGGTTEEFAKVISDAIDNYIKESEFYQVDTGQKYKNIKVR